MDYEIENRVHRNARRPKVYLFVYTWLCVCVCVLFSFPAQVKSPVLPRKNQRISWSRKPPHVTLLWLDSAPFFMVWTNQRFTFPLVGRWSPDFKRGFSRGGAPSILTLEIAEQADGLSFQVELPSLMTRILSLSSPIYCITTNRPKCPTFQLISSTGKLDFVSFDFFFNW